MGASAQCVLAAQRTAATQSSKNVWSMVSAPCDGSTARKQPLSRSTPKPRKLVHCCERHALHSAGACSREADATGFAAPSPAAPKVVGLGVGGGALGALFVVSTGTAASLFGSVLRERKTTVMPISISAMAANIRRVRLLIAILLRAHPSARLLQIGDNPLFEPQPLQVYSHRHILRPNRDEMDQLGVSGSEVPMTRSPDSRSLTRMRLRFVGLFSAIALVLFAIYTFPYEENGISEAWFASYLSWYARLAGSVLHLFDPSVGVDGSTIVGRYALSIVKSCDAMEAMILFSAAVLAFPVALTRRMIGVLCGLVILVGTNIVRICCLYFIGVYRPAVFELFHIEVWPLILVAVAVTAFLLWVTWANRNSLGDLRASA